MTAVSAEPPEISIRTDPDSKETHVHLMLGEKCVSWLSIIPFTIRIRAATVRMDGIGGVGTDPQHRNRGYSRRVLEAAIAHMRSGDGALSMLYGIPDFYPKFGYATAGPDHLAILNQIERPGELPAEWTVRDFVASDLPAMQALYARTAEWTVGAAVRPAEGGVWSHLTGETDDDEPDACRVVIGSDGRLRGYVWRARWCWYVRHKLETDFPEALVLGEVMADDYRSAHAVLAVCRQWAQAEAAQRTVKQIVLALTSQGSLGSAICFPYSQFIRNYSACGGSMARVLDVTRLLTSLAPELQASLQRAQSRFIGTIVFQTDIGDATLHIAPDAVTVETGAAASADALRVTLPQSELARMALGAFSAGDLLSRLPVPANEEVETLLENMFPLRSPHMYLPDRY